MSVELRPIKRDDLLPLLQLSVAEAQKEFIVHNAITLAQAAYEPNASIFGIWVGDEPVGLTTVIDLRGYPYLGESHDPNAGYVWRLMIGEAYQRRGFGRDALHRLADWALLKGLPRLFISTVQTNVGALRLYRSFGFRPTGRMAEGEMELSYTVASKRRRRRADQAARARMAS
jgi:diamine N-acetyltransferase